MNNKIKKNLGLLIGLLLINIANQSFYSRYDITQDKRYTLSETSHSILKKIELNKTIIFKKN